jgi:hypothetical protein
MNNVDTYAYGKKMSQSFVPTTDLRTPDFQTPDLQTEQVSAGTAHLISDHDFTVRLNDALKSSQEDRKAPSLRELFRGIQQIVRE